MKIALALLLLALPAFSAGSAEKEVLAAIDEFLRTYGGDCVRGSADCSRRFAAGTAWSHTGIRASAVPR